VAPACVSTDLALAMASVFAAASCISALLEGREAADPAHGTAIAVLLVGAPIRRIRRQVV
jgi:hypothetical protein